MVRTPLQARPTNLKTPVNLESVMVAASLARSGPDLTLWSTFDYEGIETGKKKMMIIVIMIIIIIIVIILIMMIMIIIVVIASFQ